MNVLERFKLTNRVVVLTGGAGLLGRVYARAIVEAGGRVVNADVADREAGEGLPADRYLFVKTDVADPASVRAMVGRVVERFGTIDGLVNNAAIDPKFDAAQAGKHTARFEDYPLELWKQSLDVNLTGTFLVSQAVGEVMRGQTTGGSIVNICSTYGLVAPDQRLYDANDGTSPGIKPAAYAATKAAVAQFTRYLATYWAGLPIRVNTLTPGGVRNAQDAGFQARYAARTPMGRMAEREEMCGPLVFLLSDASSYMTGANLVVDGGWTAW